MIRCRKCGITYKDDATMCLRCLNPLPKPTGKASVRKPVRKEVLDKIIAENRPKNILVATATPRPHKVEVKPHSNTPFATATPLPPAILAKAHHTTPPPNTVPKQELSKSPPIEVTSPLQSESTQEVIKPLTGEQVTSSSVAKITAPEVPLETSQVEIPEPSVTTPEPELVKEETPQVQESVTEKAPDIKYKQELESLLDAVKDLNPDKTVEGINPQFGEIRADEVERLSRVITKLDHVEEVYARSEQRIMFNRGYVLQSGYITHLNIFNLGISTLPDNLESLKKLTSLDLEKNNFDTLPQGLEKLVSLESLNISENKLRVLSSSIRNLPHLKSLSLYDNEISQLPQELSLLKNLEHLDLRGNKLNEGELDSIYELKKLKYLSLESNNIRLLSDKLDELTDLEVLLLGHNPIEQIPDISNLKNLRELSLYDTKLKYIPESILFLPGLQKLDIYNTSIKTDDWLLIELEEAGVNINMP